MMVPDSWLGRALAASVDAPTNGTPRLEIPPEQPPLPSASLSLAARAELAMLIVVTHPQAVGFVRVSCLVPSRRAEALSSAAADGRAVV